SGLCRPSGTVWRYASADNLSTVQRQCGVAWTPGLADQCEVRLTGCVPAHIMSCFAHAAHCFVHAAHCFVHAVLKFLGAYTDNKTAPHVTTGTGAVIMIYTSAQMAPTVAPATILVVDDESTNVAVLERVLEAAGYRVITASNGHETMAILAQTPP